MAKCVVDESISTPTVIGLNVQLDYMTMGRTDTFYNSQDFKVSKVSSLTVMRVESICIACEKKSLESLFIINLWCLTTNLLQH